MSAYKDLENITEMAPTVGANTDRAEIRPAILEATLEASFNNLLANEFTLFIKTLKYHWNVTGERFYSIHEFLESHYKELLIVIDGMAERIREIKAYPIGTMAEFVDQGTLAEHPGTNPDAAMMLIDLLKDHDLIRKQIQSMIDKKQEFKMQASTEDFLVGVLKKHDEMAWALRSSSN